MIKKKKEKEMKYRLSDDAIKFIKKYAIPYLKIDDEIKNVDILINIEGISREWEDDMIDRNGKDKDYYYPEKERNELADKFITEVSARIEHNVIFDFENLNTRLKNYKD